MLIVFGLVFVNDVEKTDFLMAGNYLAHCLGNC
jgi:hypothetical protein